MMSRKSPDERRISAADSIRVRSTPEEQFPSASHLKWSVTFLLVYFGLRLLFFSVTISEYVPPDEMTHFGLSRIYAKVFFLPENSPETYRYGLVTNIPYLYYWIMGKLLALNVFGIPDLLFLRLLNIPFAFATVYFVWRILRLLTDDRLSQVLLIVAMTNTLMFTFLSAFVSYDNLTNLLAAMAVYYLLAFFKTRSGDLLAVSFLCQMAGSLTKSTFLPLVLALNILLVIHEFKSFRVLPDALPAWFKAADWRRLGLVLGFSLGLALNIYLYGGNYIRYGKPTPLMSDVLSPEKAMQYRIEARDTIFTLFKEGRISKQEALAMTSQINHPKDRNDGIQMIENYFALQNNRSELLGPLAYMVYWVRHMSAGIFGILGHLLMLNRGPTVWPFAALSALTGLGILVRWRPSDAAWLPSCLMVIATFYGFFLLYGVNYHIYLITGHLDLTLHGRYIFPVLGPIYAVSSYYLPRLFRSVHPRLGVSVAACVFFIASDFPYFLSRVTSEWFVPLLR